jgi:hypothetical protein
MLADNIVWLKKHAPSIYHHVRKWEETTDENNFLIETARDGNRTLKYQDDGQEIYLHSKYNPIREADSIIDQFVKKEEITNETQVVFYGVGLGYHIEVFLKRYPNTDFYIVEPSVEVLSMFLDNIRLNNLPMKNLKLLQCGNDPNDLYNQIIKYKEKSIVICAHPVYPQIFKNEYKDFLGILRNIVKDRKISLKINYNFKKRWIINSVNNFKEVLKTPNILMEHNNIFEGKTAILVAAGPSLDFEIENLKKIKREGLAYIFAAGTSINTLIHHNILPDAVCTYDPTEANQKVFININNLEIKNVPLVFGSSVGYEVLEQYKGPKIHMITTQDTISNFFLNAKNDNMIDRISDSPSIAVVTYELLVKLGFGKIILVGQNLSYTNQKIYASGVTHRSNDVGNIDFSLVENVNGGKNETSEHLLQMKKMLEYVIERNNTITFNTTIDGAKIKGVEFTTLNEIMVQQLHERQVDGCAFEKILNMKNDIYDFDVLNEKRRQLNEEYERYMGLVIQIEKVIKLLYKTVDNYKFNASQNKLSNMLKSIEKNDYFRVVASPLNRVEYSLAVEYSSQMGDSRIPLNKRKKQIEPIENLIIHLLSEIELNKRIMFVINNTIEQYLKEKE